MKKLLFLFLLAQLVFIVGTSYADSLAGTDPCAKVSVEELAKHIPIPSGFSIVGQRPIFGICEVIVKVESENIPIYYLNDFVIAGDLFKDRRHLTMETLNNIKSVSFKRYQQDIENVVAFSFKPSKSGDKVLYMFTDPECAYCEMSKFQVKEFAAKRNIEVKVVFYPLQAHEKARDKAVRGICSKMDYSAYLEGVYGDKPCPEGEKKVSKALALGESLNIGGTPTFITQDGKVLNGYDADELAKLF